jgi:N-acetylglucosaminyl-diphospho-decaprenol L-rhamnosyltransferase
MLDLGIIIVHYRTPRLLRDCLASVFASQGDVGYRVCVVDNCSRDESCEMVELEYPQVDVIASETNGGFSYANNLGLRAFGWDGGVSSLVTGEASEELPRYALLLNPDTVLPPTALAEMVAFMDAHPDVGAAGPRLVRQDGTLDLACRRSFPTPEIAFYRMLGLSKLFPKSRRFGRYNMTFLDPSITTEVDAVVGAFMMVRREAIRDVGLLDEQFFMYGEDLDWAFRMKQAGWRICYNADVTVLHYKEAASRHSRKARYEFYRAMYLFYQKHYAATTPFWLGATIVLGIVIRGGIALGWSMVRGARSSSGVEER